MKSSSMNIKYEAPIPREEWLALCKEAFRAEEKVCEDPVDVIAERALKFVGGDLRTSPKAVAMYMCGDKTTPPAALAGQWQPGKG